jgi:hypothetical protein
VLEVIRQLKEAGRKQLTILLLGGWGWGPWGLGLVCVWGAGVVGYVWERQEGAIEIVSSG